MVEAEQLVSKDGTILSARNGSDLPNFHMCLLLNSVVLGQTSRLTNASQAVKRKTAMCKSKADAYRLGGKHHHKTPI
jgi:hypothetical protein